MKAILILFSIANVICIEYYSEIYKYVIDYNNNSEDIYNQKYLDTNYFYKRENKKPQQCLDGKTSEKYDSEYKDICTKCSIFYKYENSIDGPNCIKCPDGQIASFEDSHNKILCNISFSDYELTQIGNNSSKLDEEENCNELLEDSIGREENTPPILEYCQCPNNRPRVEFVYRYKTEKNHKYHCLSQESALKYISSDKLDYSVVYFLENTNYLTKFITYRNCNPHRITISFVNLCLCPPKQMYSDGKCKICTDSEPSDHDKEIKCIKCPKGKILTLDGKGCMCPYSDVPQSKDCNEATENEKFCSGNLGLKDSKCKPCTKNRNKSKTTGQCICPEGKYINSTDACVDCTNGLTTNEINQTSCICPKGKYINPTDACVECTNGLTTNEINQTSCICPKGKYINLNDACVDCTNGLTTNKINQTSCICPEGKYIYNESKCIECPIGQFSTSIDSKKCNICSFFKTTENSQSKSESQCNKINYLHLFSILCIIGLIIFLCFLITFFIVKKRRKKTNINNQNGNQAITGQYLNECTIDRSHIRNSKKSTKKSNMSKLPQQEN